MCRHGVCISDSVVCCEDTCILISTLYGVSIYSSVGLALSVYCIRFPKTSNDEQAVVKHPRLLYVGNPIVYRSFWDACEQ